jgi:hypothetical protein
MSVRRPGECGHGFDTVYALLMVGGKILAPFVRPGRGQL